MKHSVARVQKTWDTLATIDPMWAILTDPVKLGLKWSIDDFFEFGAREIDSVVRTIEELAPGAARDRALDFGCGIGRLTRGLAAHYREADGVDIAPSMIALADEHNPEPERIHFHLNEISDLSIFPDQTFDLVYSNIVLQHMPPKLALRYIAEFGRCTRQGGLVVFQVPHVRHLNLASMQRYVLHAAYTVAPHWLVRSYRRRKYKDVDPEVVDRLPKIVMAMHAVRRERIDRALGERFTLLECGTVRAQRAVRRGLRRRRRRGLGAVGGRTNSRRGLR